MVRVPARVLQLPHGELLRPPTWLSPRLQTLLAASAEFLSVEFGLPVPEWVHEPRYTLPEPWDPWEDICPDVAEFREERVAKAHPIFLRHGVVYESRTLIRL